MSHKERFRVTGKITRLLGRESVADPVVALFEVIKNSHDADALSVHIKFDTISGNNKIIIKEKFGDGMTYEQIKNDFLVIGTYAKQAIKGRPKKTRRLKRPMMGQKGVGRFALEKLGSKATIISKPIGTLDKFTFTIDWDRFEPENVTVDMIPITIHKDKRIDKKDSGLEIEIKGLRDNWTSQKIKELITYLQSFILPRQLQPRNSFNIELEAPAQGIEKREIDPQLDEKAFFSLSVNYAKNADHFLISAEKMGRSYIKKQKRETFRSHLTGEIRNVSDLKCGPVKLYVYYFPTFKKAEKYPQLEEEYYRKAIDYYTEMFYNQIPEIMQDKQGVKIYRAAGIREFQYGDPGNDWVDRGKISRNLAGTMQADRIIGFCILPNNPEIIATTNRREAVENEAFLDLKDLVISSMKILDQKISDDRAKLYAEAKEEDEKNKEKLKNELTEILETKTDESEKTQQYKNEILTKAKKVIDESLNEEETETTIREIELAHAIVGHFISKLYHDFVASGIQTITNQIGILEDHVKGVSPRTPDKLESVIEKLRKKWDKISIIFDALDNIERGVGVENYYKREKVDILVKDEIQTIFEDLQELTGFDNILLENKINRNLEIWTYGPIFYSIVYNLLTNSLKALMKSKPKDRENWIFVKSEVDEKHLKLIFADNSTIPIPENRWKVVFDPWISTTTRIDNKKFRGKGIGLSICKEILKFVKGEISIEEPILVGGTTFVVRFPRTLINPEK
ncbi:MAG: ATP-binding protein [Nitrosarchaeum sp.]|nr:ATP-binding protein [Nitrosarchaeum sp.]